MLPLQVIVLSNHAKLSQESQSTIIEERTPRSTGSWPVLSNFVVREASWRTLTACRGKIGTVVRSPTYPGLVSRTKSLWKDASGIMYRRHRMQSLYPGLSWVRDSCMSPGGTPEVRPGWIGQLPYIHHNIYTSKGEKEIKNPLDKRLFKSDGTSLPFGYEK